MCNNIYFRFINMTYYNIYFGTIGKTLGCKYRYTTQCKSEKQAKELAKDSASSLFYKYEGKYGIPTFSDIAKESELTGVSMETLYEDHINDMCRWYAIPTSLDSIPTKKLKW